MDAREKRDDDAPQEEEAGRTRQVPPQVAGDLEESDDTTEGFTPGDVPVPRFGREMPAPGHLVAGRFRVEGVLGRGGMGVVYLARDTESGAAAALKLLGRVGLMVPSSVLRTKQEARLLASLDHPNIVRVIHWGEADGLPYLALEYVEGRTLEEMVRAGVPRPELVRIVAILARTVAYLHRRDVVHRDLKPKNVIVEKGSRRPVLLDFGISKSRGAMPITKRHTLLGSLPYLAPEYILNRGVYTRGCDLYAIGVILYRGLCREFPHELAGETEFYAHRSYQPPRDIRGFAELPEGLAEVAMRAVARAPEERFADGDALADALSPWEEGR